MSDQNIRPFDPKKRRSLVPDPTQGGQAAEEAPKRKTTGADYILTLEGKKYRIHSDSALSTDELQEAAEQFAQASVSAPAPKAARPGITGQAKASGFDPQKQAAYEELLRRGALSDPRKQEVVHELARRGVIHERRQGQTPAAKAGKPVMTGQAEPSSVTVEIPDIGTVEFPASMTMQQIQEAARRLYANRKQAAAKQASKAPTFKAGIGGLQAPLRRQMAQPTAMTRPHVKVGPLLYPQNPPTGDRIYAAPQENLLSRGWNLLTGAVSAPFQKVDELTARALINTGFSTKGGRQAYVNTVKRYMKAGYDENKAMQMALSDRPFWEAVAPGVYDDLASAPGVIGGLQRFVLNVATPSVLVPVGGAETALAKAPRAVRAAARLGEIAMGAPAAVQGGKKAVEGVRKGDTGDITEGLLTLALGGLGVARGAWPEKTGRLLAPRKRPAEAGTVETPRGEAPQEPQKRAEDPTRPPTRGGVRPKARGKQAVPTPVPETPVPAAQTARAGVRPRARGKVTTAPEKRAEDAALPPNPAQGPTPAESYARGLHGFFLGTTEQEPARPEGMMPEEAERIRRGVVNRMHGEIEAPTPSAPKPEETKAGAKPALAPPAPTTATGRIRMADIEAAAAEHGADVPDRAAYREGWETVKRRAMANYEEIVPTLKNYDPETNPTITDDETVVAGARIRELARVLQDAEKKGDAPAQDAALLEIGHLSRLLHRSGSAAGRSLNLRKTVVPDPTDVGAVLLRAERLTDGNLSAPARQSLLRQAQEAKEAKEAIDAQVEAKAQEAAGPRGPAGERPSGFGAKNTRFTQERRAAALERLRKKMGEVSGVIDPASAFVKMLPELYEIGGYYVEGGVREFGAWAKRMRSDVHAGLDDDTLRHVWERVQGDLKKTPTQEGRGQRLMEGARERLSRLGEASKRPKPTRSQVASAEWEFARGARSLDAFAKRIRAKFGSHLDDAFLNDLFQKAAQAYAKDYRKLDAIQGRMADTVLREARRNRPLLTRFLGGVAETTAASRAILTSFDLSAPGRQGLVLSLSHPGMAARAFGPMLKALVNPDVAAAVEAEIHARPHAQNGTYDRAGLYIAERGAKGLSLQEEKYRSDLAERIPVIGRIVKGSEDAYTTFLNRLRADAFDQLSAKLPNASEKELQAVANFVNAATGRGSLGGLTKGADTLAKIFFSPRLVASRFQLLAGEPVYKGALASRRAGALVAREYLRTAGGLAVVYGLLSLSGGERENDPRSSDFGKVKFGKVVIDPLAGLAQAATFAVRELTGKTKTSTGEVTPLSGEGPYSANRLKIAERFLRSKLAPIPGSLASLADEEQGEPRDYTGQPTSLGQEVVQNLIPMSLQDIYNAGKAEGLTPRGALGLLSILGIGVSGRSQPQTGGGSRSRSSSSEEDDKEDEAPVRF